MPNFRQTSAWLMVCVLGIVLLGAGCSKKSAPELTTDPGSSTSENTGGSGGDTGGNIDTGNGELDRPRTLSPVFFDYDAFSLRSDARRTIEENSEAILANPEWSVITLEGHCDERGTVEYNLALGQKRADSVKSYLTQLGVPGQRVQTISYGEERPFVPGHEESAWAQNRRVHFSR